MKLRKINRGLVLGAVLVAGTVGYVVYGNTQFSKHKPDIEKTVSAYFSDCCSANITASEKNDSTPLSELVEKYLTTGYTPTGDMAYYRYYTKSSTLAELSDYGKDNNASGNVESMEYKIKSISISKYGSSGALVSLDFSLTSTYYGNPECYYGELSTFNNLDDYSDSIPDESTHSQLTADFYNASLIMNLEDGEWKIVDSVISGWGSSYTPLDESDTDSATETIDTADTDSAESTDSTDNTDSTSVTYETADSGEEVSSDE
jgi:hypothetical protein